MKLLTMGKGTYIYSLAIVYPRENLPPDDPVCCGSVTENRNGDPVRLEVAAEQ
jgi:hypothetical protein